MYQVLLLDGRKVGPYDRRTIVGMRIKKTLASENRLVATDGRELTVGELLRGKPRDANFQPSRSGSYSLVQATFTACLVGAVAKGLDLPQFRGEMEVRVQTDVLRISGRYRKGLGSKEGRVKVPMRDVVHARVQGSQVELWIRQGTQPDLHRFTLDLFSPESAGELVDWLPGATPPAASAKTASAPVGNRQHLLWMAVVGTALLVGLILIYVLSRRTY